MFGVNRFVFESSLRKLNFQVGIDKSLKFIRAAVEFPAIRRRVIGGSSGTAARRLHRDRCERNEPRERRTASRRWIENKSGRGGERWSRSIDDCLFTERRTRCRRGVHRYATYRTDPHAGECPVLLFLRVRISIYTVLLPREMRTTDSLEERPRGRRIYIHARAHVYVYLYMYLSPSPRSRVLFVSFFLRLVCVRSLGVLFAFASHRTSLSSLFGDQSNRGSLYPSRRTSPEEAIKVSG